MMQTNEMIEAVRAAWTPVPAPSPALLQPMAWALGQDGWEAIVGIAPVDVDIDSPGFLACTSLFDMPGVAAAAYLGTYLLSLLASLELQAGTGLFYDILTRAHLMHCLTQSSFWNDIRPHLTPACRAALVAFVDDYLPSQQVALAMPDEDLTLIKTLARAD